VFSEMCALHAILHLIAHNFDTHPQLQDAKSLSTRSCNRVCTRAFSFILGSRASPGPAPKHICRCRRRGSRCQRAASAGAPALAENPL
jgi:hypothetical protein